MAPGPFTDPGIPSLQPHEAARLLEIAVLAVRRASEEQPAPVLDLAREPGVLALPGATFVTLRNPSGLRGCIGSLEAARVLAADVVHNAFAAARHDPRFHPLTVAELPGLNLSVSTLGPWQALPAASRAELIATLQPGLDGLVVRCGTLRATFLPAVWEQLPKPDEFVDALWRKARLPPGTWPAHLELASYRVQTLGMQIPG